MDLRSEETQTVIRHVQSHKLRNIEQNGDHYVVNTDFSVHSYKKELIVEGSCYKLIRGHACMHAGSMG